MKKNLLFIFIVGAAWLLATGVSHAACTKTWLLSSPGTWSTSGNWNPSGIPGSGDTVCFSPTGTGNATIDVSVSVAGIQIQSGYIGTITQSSGHTITVGSGGFSQAAGTFTGSFASSASNNITVNGPYSLTGGTFTSTKGTLILNGSSDAFLPAAFQNNSGTVQFAQSAAVSGSSTFYAVLLGNNNNTTLTVPTGTVLTAQGPVTFEVAYSRVSLDGGGELDAQGDVLLGYAWQGGGAEDAAGFRLVLTGTGAQTVSDQGFGATVTDAFFFLPNLVINKSSGSVSFQGYLQVNSWTNNASSGVTMNMGTSTVMIGWNPTSVVINGSTTFNNLWLSYQANSSTTFILSSGTVLTAQGSFGLFAGCSNYAQLIGGEIDIQGNFEEQYNGCGLRYTSSTASTTLFALTGIGTQVLGADDIWNFGNSYTYIPNLTINKPTGSVVIQHTIFIDGNWINNASSGVTMDPGTSTVVIGNDLPAVTINGSSTFNNLLLNGGTPTTTFTLSSGTMLTVRGNLQLPSGCGGFLQFFGGEVDVYGNFDAVYSGCALFFPASVASTTLFTLAGTGNQIVGYDDPNAIPGVSQTQTYIPNLTINKSAGSVTLQGSLRIPGNWINNVSSGVTMDPGTSTAAFGDWFLPGDSSLFLKGSSTFNNLVFGQPLYGNNVTITVATDTTLTAQGVFYLAANGGYVKLLGGGRVNVWGDIGGGHDVVSATGTVLLSLTGTSTQIIDDNPLGYYFDAIHGLYLPNLTVNKPSGIAYIANSPVIVGNLFVSQGQLNLATGTATQIVEIDGTVTVNSGAILSDYPAASSTIQLGSSIMNNGSVFFDGAGPGCGSVLPNNVILRSTASAQRTWSGTGAFLMRYVDVQYQKTSGITIDDWNGTNSGNNSGFNFITGQPRAELVQSAVATGTTAVTLPAFTPIQQPLVSFSPQMGDLIVVAVSARNISVAAPTDTASNTYTLVNSSAFDSSPGYTLAIYYAKNIVSSSTFRISVSGTATGGSPFLSVGAYEYAGMAPSTTLDSYSANTGNNATALTSFSATALNQGELYFGAMTLSASTTAAASWTARAGVTDNVNSQALYVQDIATTTVLTTSSQWTAATSTDYADILALFKTPYTVNFAASGTLDSATFDTGVTGGVQLNSFIWRGTQPDTTHNYVDFQFAVSNSSIGPWNFMGPDGVPGSVTSYFTGLPGVPISLRPTASNGYAIFSGYRYYRYRATLFSDVTQMFTPVVSQVTVNWSP